MLGIRTHIGLEANKYKEGKAEKERGENIKKGGRI